MSCRTCCCKKLSFVFALFVMAVVLLRATPAFAGGTCLADVDATIAKHLGASTCTANDVRVAEAINPRAPDGTPITTCFATVPFSFIADFEVVTTATSRENIGFFMRTDGLTPTGANACTINSLSTCNAAEFPGACADNIVSPLHWPGAATRTNPLNSSQTCSTTAAAGSTQCLGSAGYVEDTPTLKNGSADNCGDTHSGTSPQFITIAVNGIVCPNVGQNFILPNCTTWWQPTDTFPACFSDPNQGWPWVSAAVAGTTSKCNCSGVSIPITPINYAMTASKTPSPASYPDASSGNFTYTVGVTNGTSFGGGFASEIITQVCDSVYGNIGTNGACSGGSNAGNGCAAPADCSGGTCIIPQACPNGSACTGGAGTFCGTGTPTCTLPQTVAQGVTNSNLCSFATTFNPGTLTGSLTDTVTVNGFGNNGQSSPPPVTASASATVTVAEVAATASVVKSLDSGHECATIRYKVVVSNTSANGSDEAESLSVLHDNKYGDLTVLSAAGANPALVGTTCGQAPTVNNLPGGIGTLSGSNGAGTLPATIAAQGNYTCEFDGQFCGALGTAGANCTTGLEQTDTITATLSDDGTTPEGNTVTVDNSNASLTVDVCFAAHN